MAKILIDLPDDLHRGSKIRAVNEGVTLKKLIVAAVREYLERHPPMEFSRQLSILEDDESQNK